MLSHGQKDRVVKKMSVKISVFDFFSFTIPGLICEFLFYYIDLQFFNNIYFKKIVNFEINIYYISILIILAYLLGLILDHIVNFFWFEFFTKSIKEKTLSNIIANHNALKNELDPSYYLFYRTHVLIKDKEYFEKVDRYDAISILLKSTSFVLLMLSITELVVAFKYFFSFHHFILAIMIFVFSILSLYGAKKYRIWAIGNIYSFILTNNMNVEQLNKN